MTNRIMSLPDVGPVKRKLSFIVRRRRIISFKRKFVKKRSESREMKEEAFDRLFSVQFRKKKEENNCLVLF